LTSYPIDNEITIPNPYSQTIGFIINKAPFVVTITENSNRVNDWLRHGGMRDDIGSKTRFLETGTLIRFQYPNSFLNR